MPTHAELDENNIVVKRLVFEEDREPEDFLDGSSCGIGDTWNGTSFVPPDPAPVPIEDLRAEMKCSPLQGRLALGETTWAAVEAIAQDPETPWAVKQNILAAGEWSRLSQTIDLLGWTLGFTAEQMDDLFVAAMAIDP